MYLIKGDKMRGCARNGISIYFKGTIYQFTLDTRYSIFENIKKGDFQTETVF